MLVTLLCDRVGETFQQYEGETIELPDREAMRLIQAGQAEVAEPETASVLPQTETATLNRARPRRR